MMQGEIHGNDCNRQAKLCSRLDDWLVRAWDAGTNMHTLLVFTEVTLLDPYPP
jgi:hypothetical protein